MTLNYLYDFAHETMSNYMYDIARFQCCSPLRSVNLLSLFIVVQNCMDTNSTKLLFADILLYGDEKASTDDCFKMFNSVEKTTFDLRIRFVLS